MKRPYWRALLLLLLTTGYASTSAADWKTQKAERDFVDGTKVLAELIMLTTRSEALSGRGLLKNWKKRLLEAGYHDEDIVDGSEATVWTYCYAHNGGVSPCQHHGHYIAHVPVELRRGLTTNNGKGTKGDLVEIELTRTRSGYLVGKMVRVFSKSGEQGPCRQASAAGPGIPVIGGGGATWLECEGVERDGWVRKRIEGAPISIPVSQWVKLP